MKEIRRAEERVLPSVWSERHRVIHDRPWSFRGREWMRDIMDDASAEVVVRKSAQLGVTEMLQCLAMHSIDFQRSAMIVFPTDDTARRHSRARFEAALEASAYLRDLFADGNSSVDVKRSRDTQLYFEGSNSADALYSVPVSLLLIDEYDRVRQDAIRAARWRLSGQTDGRMVVVSTPTIGNYGIDALWASSSQRRWHAPCPSCGQYVFVEGEEPRLEQWSGITWRDWPKIPDPTEMVAVANTARLLCSACRHPWTESERLTALDHGRWVSMRPTASGIASGYTLSQWHSPVRSTADVVLEYFRAVHDPLPAAMRQFVNQGLGLPWIGESAPITDEMVGTLVTSAVLGDVPAGLRCAGVDVGKKLHVVLGGIAGGTLVARRVVLIDSFESLDQMIRAEGLCSVVVDAYPDTREAERLCAAWPGVVYRAAFPEGRKELYTFDPSRQWVDIRRVDAVDQQQHRIRTAKLSIWREGEWEMLVKHLTRVVVTIDTDGHGNAERRVEGKVGGPDDAAFALLYLEAACARVSRGEDLLPRPIFASEADQSGRTSAFRDDGSIDGWTMDHTASLWPSAMEGYDSW